MRHQCVAVAMLIALEGGVSPLVAQQRDSTRARIAAFVGRLVNQIDSTPVRSADLRLLFVDSSRVARGSRGQDSLEVFIDTLRSRVGVSDSTGAFAIRRLAEGKYVMNVRRIGFAQLDGVLGVDTGIVRGTLFMEPISKLLSKAVVRETSVDVVKQRLDRVGYMSPYHSGLSGTYVDRAQILRRKPQTVREILSWYGIYEGDFMLDRMPTDYDMLSEYPADMVLGIEIYRHGRPTEFNGTRSGPSVLSPGGMHSAMMPLVLIWTYIP